MEKQVEFIRLFQEFISSYPYTPEGLRHTAAYEKQRQQGKRNFEAIATAAEFGEDVTEAVLLQLLPYTDSANNRQKGAWIHNAPYINGDLKGWLEKSGWTKSEDWSFIAQAILRFVRHCNDVPSQLLAACLEFLEQPYSHSFQMGTLTPILHALRPDEFLLINTKSRKVINYFANTSYEEKLIDYPAANITGHKLIRALAKEMHQLGAPALRDDDLFDMFCNWLVAVKKYNFVGKEPQLMGKVVKFTSDVEDVELQPKYTLIQLANDTGFNEAQLKRWVKSTNRKKQAILSGSPGTGKTFIAEKLAQHLIGGGDGFYELLQFHPAYSYEDFIQGIRPQSEDGQLTYPLIAGRFLEFCQKAESGTGLCVLIIDEINRANLSQVFGELMYLLEYRDKKIRLAGSNEPFSIPENVRIIGTMNTADRSIALVDHALRRRFAFIELRPNYEVLRQYHEQNKTGFQVDGLTQTLKRLNSAIADKHYELGISFFLTEKLAEDIEDIWQMEVEPYLEEYFFDQPEKVDDFRWLKIKSQIIL